ncbi:hypothetical protein PIB30_073448 [Stylosanthes scabra]|uniref:Uncharacterized protein n=1 Tax=Stylosanthes scabra TaxID=79078 RepID=A0ABU6YQQ4_9FABA|nr:hypothetical protein [Stylosanthes scabra]
MGTAERGSNSGGGGSRTSLSPSPRNAPPHLPLSSTGLTSSIPNPKLSTAHLHGPELSQEATPFVPSIVAGRLGKDTDQRQPTSDVTAWPSCRGHLIVVHGDSTAFDFDSSVRGPRLCSNLFLCF